MWALVLIAGAIATGLYTYRAPISGYADAGSAYAARVGCSCRFVAGRSLSDCEKDKLAGMELVTLAVLSVVLWVPVATSCLEPLVVAVLVCAFVGCV